MAIFNQNLLKDGGVKKKKEEELPKNKDGEAEAGQKPQYTPPTYTPPTYTPPSSPQAPTINLEAVLAQKPQDFDYDQYNRILGMMENYQNREFSYDLNADMLYQQYKNQYMQNGQRAMQDTVGQVAALNGGYANSYAQTAGQQAYNNELSKLNNVIPDLYQLAYSRYQNEGDEMLKGIELANDAYKTRYNEYQDALGNWRNDVNLANNLYQDERNYQQKQQAYDLDNYQTALSMAQQNAGSSSLNATMNELVRMGIIDESTAQNLYGTYADATPAKQSVQISQDNYTKMQNEIEARYLTSADALQNYLKNAERNGWLDADTAQRLFEDNYYKTPEGQAEKEKEETANRIANIPAWENYLLTTPDEELSDKQKYQKLIVNQRRTLK